MNHRAARLLVASATSLVFLAPLTACEDDPGFGVIPPITLLEGGLIDGHVRRGDATLTPAVVDSGTSVPDAAEAGPKCGNGRVDPGETCDPLASCPTTCAPVGCQLRALEKAGTCEATCVATTMQTACANADGCCPSGCTGANDSDCTATCGNGILETGETCETTGGTLATCPTACAPVGCQLRTLEGAGTCNARCVAAAMQTTCASGDGCCPPGCTVDNDGDCAPGCGNGVLEPGEVCDPLATCPESCPPIGCQLRTMQGSACTAQCVDAGTQTACANGDGCCPTGCNANNDSDCTPKCGNAAVEPGETCDTVATCPTSCAPSGCQNYRLENALTCQATCVPSTVTTVCANGDGCCPTGCNTGPDNLDDDCPAVCGNGAVERGETCEPPKCPRGCSTSTCYGTGSPMTCDLDCSAPILTCGGAASKDSCCPYGGGACGEGSDGDCTGPSWRYIQWPAVIDSVNRRARCIDLYVGVEVGGSYTFTTCGPDAAGVGSGDPQIARVIDYETGASYGADDDCTDPNALPKLAGWTCRNNANLDTMACVPSGPGGRTARTSLLVVTVCAEPVVDVETRGITPLYVWYNAKTAPTEQTEPTTCRTNAQTCGDWTSACCAGNFCGNAQAGPCTVGEICSCQASFR
jgi:hypothetical protein